MQRCTSGVTSVRLALRLQAKEIIRHHRDRLSRLWGAHRCAAIVATSGRRCGRRGAWRVKLPVLTAGPDEQPAHVEPGPGPEAPVDATTQRRALIKRVLLLLRRARSRQGPRAIRVLHNDPKTIEKLRKLHPERKEALPGLPANAPRSHPTRRASAAGSIRPECGPVRPGRGHAAASPL
jgi:hypothetical protein